MKFTELDGQYHLHSNRSIRMFIESIPKMKIGLLGEALRAAVDRKLKIQMVSTSAANNLRELVAKTNPFR